MTYILLIENSRFKPQIITSTSEGFTFCASPVKICGHLYEGDISNMKHISLLIKKDGYIILPAVASGVISMALFI